MANTNSTHKKISDAELEAIRRIDLLTYFEIHAPGELVRISGNTYCTKEHDSLKIQPTRWFWWSRGFGGRNALDYLIKGCGKSFKEAVDILRDSGCAIPPPRIVIDRPKECVPKVLTLPPRNTNHDRAVEYLASRGLPKPLIEHCISVGSIYEDRRHNCVFVGYDENNRPKHAALRGTYITENGRSFRGDAPGSDKHYGFSLKSEKADTVCVFEAPIDLLSYYVLHHRRLENTDYISVSGVYKPQIDGSYKMPLALTQYLESHPTTKRIVICFDNDEVGHEASKALAALCKDKYEIAEHIPKTGKDWNDVLTVIKKRSKCMNR